MSQTAMRRRFLQVAGLVSVGASAGCLGNDDDDSDETENTTDDESDESDTADEETDEDEDLRSIEIGETATGYLDHNDPTDPVHDDLAEPVEFETDANTTVRITMESDDLDSYLVLIDPSDSVVAEDDDGAEGLNSEIVTPLEKTGSYTIWAGSVTGVTTGEYTLSVEETDEESDG